MHKTSWLRWPRRSTRLGLMVALGFGLAAAIIIIQLVVTFRIESVQATGHVDLAHIQYLVSQEKKSAAEGPVVLKEFEAKINYNTQLLLAICAAVKADCPPPPPEVTGSP